MKTKIFVMKCSAIVILILECVTRISEMYVRTMDSEVLMSTWGKLWRNILWRSDRIGTILIPILLFVIFYRMMDILSFLIEKHEEKKE